MFNMAQQDSRLHSTYLCPLAPAARSGPRGLCQICSRCATSADLTSTDYAIIALEWAVMLAGSGMEHTQIL